MCENWNVYISSDLSFLTSGGERGTDVVCLFQDEKTD